MLFGSVSLAAGTIVMYLGLLRALDPHFADKAGAGSLRAAVASGVIAILITTVFGFVLLPFESAYPSLLEEVLLTGFVEEYAKFLAFAIVLRRRDAFREPLDAATHAAAVGLGFSVIENIMYGFAYDHLRVHLAAVFTPPRLGDTSEGKGCY